MQANTYMILSHTTGRLRSRRPTTMFAGRFLMKVQKKTCPSLALKVFKMKSTRLSQPLIDKVTPTSSVLLHGPNGSAKSSIVESLDTTPCTVTVIQMRARCIAFNWIFPTEKSHTTKAMGASAPIGFGSEQDLDRLKNRYLCLS
jgi:hypothetical protein